MSRDRGTTAGPQPQAAADHSNHSTQRAKLTTYGEPYPEELVPFDELAAKDTTTTFSWATRRRIREAVKQLGDVVAARVANAERPQSVATRQGLILEIKAIAEAQVEGEGEDVRAAYLTAAASMVLLAEAANRDPEVPAYVTRNAARGKR